jgi:hypothetical protein
MTTTVQVVLSTTSGDTTLETQIGDCVLSSARNVSDN